MFYFIFIEAKDNESHWNELYSNLEAFIFTFLIIFIMGATAIDVQLFRKYDVNYQFIFECDHDYKLIHH